MTEVGNDAAYTVDTDIYLADCQWSLVEQWGN